VPEGDTLFKIARYLHAELQGRLLRQGQVRATPGTTAKTGGDIALDRNLSGCRITEVRARGKHLFILLDDGRLLRSHLGLWGTWHSYAPEEPWQLPRARAAILLDVGERLFVCFNPRQVEVLHPHGVRQRTLSQSIGPDLLDARIDFSRIPARAACLVMPETPLIDVLLDQRIASGIGNVYKSEVLFLRNLHPMTPLATLSETDFIALYREASRLLASNTGGGPRITRRAKDGAGMLWVYRRSGKPCHQCAAAIVSARLGRHHRSTYWCPNCQPS
jgi:endonuclease-8